jgi:hypothetical protein
VKRAAVAGMLLLALVGCSTDKKATTTTTAQPSGLGGGGGEQTSAPRSTIVTTPRPTLSASVGAKEIDGPCPYIANQDWADHEGNRVGRSVQLATTPVGCRFYFQYDPNHITGEITIQRFSTTTRAFNAVVTAANGHPEFVDDKDIGDGAISIKAALQGTPTWECIFAKGKLVVSVHTSQDHPSDNARTLARMIVPNIK